MLNEDNYVKWQWLRQLIVSQLIAILINLIYTNGHQGITKGHQGFTKFNIVHQSIESQMWIDLKRLHSPWSIWSHRLIDSQMWIRSEVYNWSIIDLSLIYHWSIIDLSLIYHWSIIGLSLLKFAWATILSSNQANRTVLFWFFKITSWLLQILCDNSLTKHFLFCLCN